MSRREYISILTRLLLIFGSLLLFCFLILSGANPVRLVFSGLLSMALTSELFYYLGRSRKQILRLLTGFKVGDPARFVEQGHDPVLVKVLNEISEEIRRNKTEREVQHQYLKSLVDHMDIAIVCFDDQWRIQMANDSWFTFVGRPYLTKLEKDSLPDANLYESIMALSPGKKESIQVNSPLGKRTFAVQMESFILETEEYRLLTAKDIEAEVQVNETEAWYKLLRVLTHEIMNSIAPVSSLSETVHQQMQENRSPSEPQLDGWRIALEAISSRSNNLLTFTNSYKRLTRLPQPIKVVTEVQPLVESIWNLFQESHKVISIHFGLKNQVVFADPAMLEQLLVNLLKNACEALAGQTNPEIRIENHLHLDQQVISIIDNGPGIPEEIASDIFLPFFTTKQDGSGVGLSLSRQIMLAHGGSIGVGKGSGETGTRIDLRFPEEK